MEKQNLSNSIIVPKIDRLTLANVKVSGMNASAYEELTLEGAIKLNVHQRYIGDFGDGMYYTSLRLTKESHFKELNIQYTVNGSYRGTMTITINDFSTENLNCFSCVQYSERIKKICSNLKNKYGMELDLHEATIHEIEINRTFIVDYPFSEYKRPLTAIFANLPRNPFRKSYMQNETPTKKDRSIKEKTGSFTTTGGRTSLRMIAYDKTAELRDVYGIKIDKNIMRLEFKLKADHVWRYLGIRYFSNLDDSLLQDFWNSFTKRCILNQYVKYEQRRKTKIKTIFKKNYDENQKKWIEKSLQYFMNSEVNNEVPILLELSDVEEALDIILKKADRQKRYRNKCKLTKIKNDKESFLNKKDSEKLKELIEKICG